MAGYEWIAVAYLSGLTLAAWVAPIGTIRRLKASAVAIAVLVLIVVVVLTAPPTVRAWAPHLYLIAGYWLPALLVAAEPQPAWRFEEWLAATDNRIRQFLPQLPEPLVQVVELAYLFCYPLVPLSFAVVWTMGDEVDVARFWLAVLLAGYSCYATLPWLVSRPPRLRGTPERSAMLARLNEQVLRRVSHQLNTFPSGHVAVAAAAAATVAVVSAPAGLVIGTIVAAISVGAAAGGYHYALDVLLGLAIAAAAVVVAGVI